MNPGRLDGVVVTLAAALACSSCGATGAAGRGRAVAAPSPAQTVASDATGVWDWTFRSTDEQGDLRVEQEEWHLDQRGSHIQGYYDRAVITVSTDERLFRCNQQRGFTKFTRVRVDGEAQADHILLHEVAFEARPGPCDDGARNLTAYVGVLHGPTLLLKWGPALGQTLVRREPGATPSPARASPSSVQAAAAREVAPEAPLAGTWRWELRSIDAEGDERLEQEVWHLNETPEGVKGFYDRTVRRTRGDGLFSCNGLDRFETVTRYSLTGQRFGDRLTLTEVDYQAKPSRCDNALRRLDTYHGHLADTETLILSWGPGTQMLHRENSFPVR